MNKKFKALFSDTIIFAVGNVLTKLVLFFLMPIYTSAMTSSDYGTGELIYNTVELTLPIATLCLYEAVFRFAIDPDSDHKKLLSNAFSLILKIFGAIFLIALIVDIFIDYPYIWYFIAMLFTWSIRYLFANFARGIGRTKTFAASGVIHALSLCCCNIVLLSVFHMGVYGYLISIIVANCISTLFLLFTVNIFKYIAFNQSDKLLLKTMLIFSLPMIPNALSWWFVNISSRYVIVGFMGASVAGLFTAASKLPSMMHLMSTIFQQAWQFSSSKEMGSKGGDKFFSDVFKLYSPFMIICTSGLVLITPLLSKVLLQGEFYEAWVYVPLLLLSACFNCYSVFFGSFYTAAKKNKMLMISTVVGAALNIGICLTTVPFIGVYGALIASCVSYFVIVAIRIVDTRKYTKIKIDWPISILSLVLVSFQATIFSVFGTKVVVPVIIIFVVIMLINLIFYRKQISKILHKFCSFLSHKSTSR